MNPAKPRDGHVDRISLDFDGCITIGGKPKGTLDIAPLRPGTEKFLRELKRKGYEIVIHTARQPAPVKHFLRKHGLSQYVNEVSRTKLPSRVYIDDRAIEFRGDFDKALGQIEDFKPHWKHDYSSTQVDLPEELSSKLQEIGKRIPDDELAKDGRETQPHITLLWGLHDSEPSDKIRGLIKKHLPIKAKLGKLKLFENDDADVLVAEVDSPSMKRLNQKLAEVAANTQTHKDYQPHATIAYILPGKGKKHLKDSLDHEAEFKAVTWSGKDGHREEIR